MKIKSSFVAIVCLLSASGMNSVRADEHTADEYYQAAVAAYAQRSPGLETHAAVIENLKNALDKVGDNAKLKFQIYALTSQAYYWQGTHLTVDKEKLDAFEKGYDAAKSAESTNANLAESYYYYAINLARWAETKGVITSIGRKDELVDYVQKTMAHNQMDGSAGNTIDGYGPDRIFGRMYFKLPGFLGGDQKKSLEHLYTAHDNAPKHALNTVYLAETLSRGDDSQKEEACDLLSEMLSQKPEDFNSARLPETRDEFKEGVDLQKLICN